MKLAYSTNGFTRVSLVDAIHGIARAGYAGVELLADTPHWRPADLESGAHQAMRRALGETGLGVSNVNANTAAGLADRLVAEPTFEPSLSHADARIRERRKDYTRAAIRLAAAVGAPAVSVSSGRTQADVAPERGFEYFAESLAELCVDAASAGVKLGIEFEPGLLVETSVEVLHLIEQVGHPALGANLDIGHALCAGEAPIDAIHRLAGRIWNVHVEDIRGRKHYHRVPGEGDVDFDAVFDALAAVSYRGFVTVELYTCSAFADEAAGRAYAHLAPRLARVSGRPVQGERESR